MKKYFMGISWIDAHHPVMLLKDYDSGNDEYVEIPNDFDMEKLKNKICSGAINPLTQEFFSCSELIDMNQSQCYSCMHKFDFYNCVRCHGNDCMSKDSEVREYCNTPHYVYLAYFSKDKIKVGTASEVRKFDRLLEQGAIFSVFIAKAPTGKIARQIEKNIIDNGMTGAVSTTFKMKNLVFNESVAKIESCLINNYQAVTKYIEEKNTQYLIRPIFIHFDNIRKNIEENMLSPDEQLDIFDVQLNKINNYKIPKESDHIVGQFLFTVGKVIALKRNGIIELYNSKKWEGFLFDFKSVKVFEACG